MQRITLPTYDVHIASGAIGAVGSIATDAVHAHRWVLITDETVAELYAGRVARSFQHAPVDVLQVASGEVQKTRDSWARLTDEMVALGVGRDAAVVAVGGGVIGDLAGFVAATFMRGVPYVQVPTTLLAMIDASIGGKTGIDTPAGKNLVGAFHMPRSVIVDPEVLATLPAAQLRSGLAEAIKHGIVADAAYFERTRRALPTLVETPRSSAMESLIRDSIAIKADVVRRDEREGSVRKILNFGHTLGHAIEAESGYRLLHGEAIGIGMALEARLAERLAIADAGTARLVTEAVRDAGLPTQMPRSLDIARVIAATRADKKARAGAVEYALPARVGTMARAEQGFTVPVDEADVEAVLRES